jgi:hypothetical protein
VRLIPVAVAALAAVAGVLLWHPWGKDAMAPRASRREPDLAGDTDRRMQAEAQKTRADRLLADRGVRPENLAEAIRLLADCRDILKPQAGRDPGPYVAASEALQAAERLQERIVGDFWVDYQRQANLRDYAAAQATLRLILRVMPDRGNPENQKARRELGRYLRSPD